MSEENLNPKQTEALAKFKEAVSDIATPEWIDHYYCRWLRARSWDLKKSEKMLREDALWRKQMGVDRILEWPLPEVLVKYYPGGYHGVDKEGFPIWLDTLGTVDLKGMMFSTTKKEIVKYKTYWVEHLFRHIFPELSKKNGRRIDQCVMIFDMEGIGMKHLWKPAVEVFTEVLALLEAHYPETLRTCYVVNAPKIFPVLYNLAKAFLHEDTRRKIQVLGTPKIFPVAYALAKPFLSEYTRSKIQVVGGNWKQHLLQYIDADQLPVNWGGTATDPDGDTCCRSKICMGGPIPESYRIDNFMDNVDMSNFTTVTIQRGSSLQLDFEVTEPNSMISWQFKSEGNDIGFGVFRRTADERQKANEMEVVLPSERVNSHMVPENGQVTCPETGTYVLRFDNTYSWVSAKKLSYMVDIHAPDAGKELHYYSTKF